VSEFSGLGRGMLLSPGTHRIKIDLPGYRTFETEITLLPNQKYTVKTDLARGSITQASSLINGE
jgi:PEGA domain